MTVDLHFYLNKNEIRTSVPAGLLVLDFVRQHHRLTGVKEGCKEGDCGACVVLVGELAGSEVRYKSITSCMMPVGGLHGKHLVTIEGLSGDELSSVQQAIVDEGGTQCGFCTPGIVVSLTGALIGRDEPMDLEATKEALGGHLCRCTGYRSLKAAWSHPLQPDLPAYFEGIPAQLSRLEAAPASNGRDEDIVALAGGTDLYVQTGDHIPTRPVAVLNLDHTLKGIERTPSQLEVGALTTFEEFSRDPDVRTEIPDIAAYMRLIASLQIRNRATLGGNVVNASPIGDITILLLAIGCDLEFTSVLGVRTVAMDDFFLGYKQLDMQAGEILRRIRLRLTNGAKLNWEKVSKRKFLDIASVNSAIRITDEDGVITEARIAVGGVAPIPLLLKETNAALLGQRINPDTVLAAVESAQHEISPISDIRGSAGYKRLLTRQLIIAHFAKLYPSLASVRAVYEAY
jgi:xanthine dehydrogenase small subunit